MDWKEFCEKIENILGFWREKISFAFDDEKISHTFQTQEIIYTKDAYVSLADSTDNCFFQQFAICSNNSYETMVDLPDIDSRRRFSMSFEEKLSGLSVNDTENGLNYYFSEASPTLIWFILKEYDNRRLITRYPYSMFERRFESMENKDIFSLLRVTLRLPSTVCVRSSVTTTREQLNRYTKSFLFNFAYNLDLVFKPVTEINDIFPQRITTNRRKIHNVDEIMAPQLAYTTELTEQYYMALASSDPFVKFIGFYHIMEYFYEEVYNEDILENVRRIIQHPGFSSKRKKDVAKVIDLVRKKTKQNKEEFQGSELEALELTIRKFVKIPELNTDLYEYDPTLIDYYKAHQVNFSDGDAIDLRDITNEKLPKKLAARIYKNRNSLVHSKSNDGRLNERGIYKPFNDSQELSMEIPLMKFIAETIIVNSALPL